MQCYLFSSDVNAEQAHTKNSELRGHTFSKYNIHYVSFTTFSWFRNESVNILQHAELPGRATEAHYISKKGMSFMWSCYHSFSKKLYSVRMLHKIEERIRPKQFL